MSDSGPRAAMVSKHSSRSDDKELLELRGLMEKDDPDLGLPLVRACPSSSSPSPAPPPTALGAWGREWWWKRRDQRWRGLGGSGLSLTSMNW